MSIASNRRTFLTAATAAGAAVAASTLATGRTRPEPGSVPKDRLPESPVAVRKLGQTGVELTLIGMGTGSVGVGQASNQTRLGVKEFTRVVRHALDCGIAFFDVADQYGSHTYLRAALKGVPRDKYVIQTKTRSTSYANCKSHIERYRMELGVDYIDIQLLHCMRTGDWQKDHAGAMEYLSEAKEQGLIRTHGTSCHGMDPLRASAQEPWVEVDLARINPEGKYMDGRPAQVAEQLEIMHRAGKGVLGMKIMGQGEFTTPARRDASLRYVLGLGTVDAFTIGFESTEQIDDVIARTADAIAFLSADV